MNEHPCRLSGNPLRSNSRLISSPESVIRIRLSSLNTRLRVAIVAASFASSGQSLFPQRPHSGHPNNKQHCLLWFDEKKLLFLIALTTAMFLKCNRNNRALARRCTSCRKCRSFKRNVKKRKIRRSRHCEWMPSCWLHSLLLWIFNNTSHVFFFHLVTVSFLYWVLFLGIVTSWDFDFCFL